MKRGTPEHPKTRDLANILGIPILHAVGILEAMFHFAAKYARNGAIGSGSNALFAKQIGWEGDPDALVDALLNAKGTKTHGWLERHDTYRLVIHDWHEHADDSVRKTMHRNGELFWNGSEPIPDKRKNKSGLNPDTNSPESGTGAKAKAEVLVLDSSSSVSLGDCQGGDDESTETTDPTGSVHTSWLKKLYNAHPRARAWESAHPEIEAAIRRVQRDRGWDVVPACTWLLSRVNAYRRSDEVTKGDAQYVPSVARWFKDGRYDDDDVVWKRGTKSDTTGPYQPSTAALDAAFAKDGGR